MIVSYYFKKKFIFMRAWNEKMEIFYIFSTYVESYLWLSTNN